MQAGLSTLLSTMSANELRRKWIPSKPVALPVSSIHSLFDLVCFCWSTTCRRCRLVAVIDAASKARALFLLFTVMKTHSNLNINLGTIEEEDDEEDGDYEDDVSEVSMDEYSFDTRTTAHQSVAFKNKKIATDGERASLPKSKEKIHGNTKLGLPYILDLWRDCCSHARVSVQVQLLSGRARTRRSLCASPLMEKS